MKVSERVDQGSAALGGRVLEFEIELEPDLAILLIRADAFVARQYLAIDERLVEVRCRQSFRAAAGPPEQRDDPGESRQPSVLVDVPQRVEDERDVVVTFILRRSSDSVLTRPSGNRLSLLGERERLYRPDCPDPGVSEDLRAAQLRPLCSSTLPIRRTARPRSGSGTQMLSCP
jgi:hypothetical protein